MEMGIESQKNRSPIRRPNDWMSGTAPSSDITSWKKTFKEFQVQRLSTIFHNYCDVFARIFCVFSYRWGAEITEVNLFFSLSVERSEREKQQPFWGKKSSSEPRGFKKYRPCFKRIVLYVCHPLNGKHKNYPSLRTPRLCGEYIVWLIVPTNLSYTLA